MLQSRHPSEETRGPRTLVLRGMQHLTVKNGDVLLLVGTNKGAFSSRSSRDRSRTGTWLVPIFTAKASTPWPTTAATAFIACGFPRIARCGARSCAPAKTLAEVGQIPSRPASAFLPRPALLSRNIWQICLGRDDEPSKLYAASSLLALSVARWWRILVAAPAGCTITPIARVGCQQRRLFLHTIVPDPTNAPEVCCDFRRRRLPHRR